MNCHGEAESEDGNREPESMLKLEKHQTAGLSRHSLSGGGT
jgi:hypothetical protein